VRRRLRRESSRDFKRERDQETEPNLGEESEDKVDGVGDCWIVGHDKTAFEVAVAVDESVDLGDANRDDDEGAEDEDPESDQDLEGNKELREKAAGSSELSKGFQLFLEVAAACQR